MQQNVTGAYVIIMLVYRRLLTTRLHGKAAVSYQITLEKQQKLFVKGYNLEVRDVTKYTHPAKSYLSKAIISKFEAVTGYRHLR